MGVGMMGAQAWGGWACEVECVPLRAYMHTCVCACECTRMWMLLHDFQGIENIHSHPNEAKKSEGIGFST